MTRDAIDDVFAAWSRGKGALLYGPAGTGKTRVLSQLFRAIQESARGEGIELDPFDAKTPLDRPKRELPIPTPVKAVWTTFHQSYSYEDFVVGLRPVPQGANGLLLQPRLGVLMDAVFELSRTDPEFGSVVIFIDELNRGNASRIFGEFLTFLDFEYRATLSDGTQNEQRLPLPLRQIDVADGMTEELARAESEPVRLSWPAYFPRDIYVVGTMNSVDRAAVPLDSALARRFERVELRPDLEVLSAHLGLDWVQLQERAKDLRQEDPESWSTLLCYEAAVLLLDRINNFLSTELGGEFELGHALLMQVKGDTATAQWARLSGLWDDVVYPQLEDRFAGRPEQLLELLKVEQPPGGFYAWTLREGLGGLSFGRALSPVKLSGLTTEQQARSLQWLCQ